MTWVKLDDGYANHPKVAEGGSDALALDIGGMCYAARYGTEGFIPERMLTHLSIACADPMRSAETLLSTGRWERDNERGGYVIHDWNDYQPSASGQTDSPPDRRRAAAQKASRARWDRHRNAQTDAQAQSDAQCVDALPSAFPPSRPVQENLPPHAKRMLPPSPPRGGLGKPGPPPNPAEIVERPRLAAGIGAIRSGLRDGTITCPLCGLTNGEHTDDCRARPFDEGSG